MSRARLRASHFVEAGALALLGAVVLLDARAYPPPLTEGAPGPAFFPRLVAALLLACAVWFAVRSLRGVSRSSASAGPAAPAAEEDGPGAGGRLRVGAAAAAIAAFLLALPHLGTLVSLPLLLFGLMRLAGERARAVLIAAPLAFAGFVVLLFEAVLGVPLP